MRQLVALLCLVGVAVLVSAQACREPEVPVAQQCPRVTYKTTTWQANDVASALNFVASTRESARITGLSRPCVKEVEFGACASAFPRCDDADSPLPVCQQTCRAIATACEDKRIQDGSECTESSFPSDLKACTSAGAGLAPTSVRQLSLAFLVSIAVLFL